MTAYVVKSDILSSGGNAYVLTDGDSFDLTAAGSILPDSSYLSGAYVYSDTANATSGVSVTINGEMLGIEGVYAIDIAHFADISIQSNGSVEAPISIGDNATLDNDGYIIAQDFHDSGDIGAINVNGNSKIINSGTISFSGGSNGISYTSIGAIKSSDEGPVSITNSGTISALDYAAIVLGAGSTINNSGIISSRGDFDFVVPYTIRIGDSSTIINSGIINGNVGGIHSFDGRYGVVNGTVSDSLDQDSVLLGSLAHPNSMAIYGIANATVVGGNADDTFLLGASAGIHSLDGGAGNDVFSVNVLSAGTNTLIGGSGFDTVNYGPEYGPNVLTPGDVGPVTVDLRITGPQHVGGGDNTETLSGIEELTGTVNADTFIAGAGAVVFLGLVGNDTLTGGAGDDQLYGGYGNDTLSGGGGDDVLSGGPGRDVIDGGTGINTADYSDATGGVTVSLALSVAQNTVSDGYDKLSHIQDITGSAYDDTLAGDAGANVLSGGVGNDTLYGGGGGDMLNGGDGNDILYGLAGTNQLDGGGNIDSADYLYSALGVTVSLVATGAQHVSSQETDTLTSIETIGGSALNDTLTGGLTLDTLVGRDGNDTLIGGAGIDQLYGGAGNDMLIGGGGNDVFNGGPGNDTMTGGTGKDGFIFDAPLGATNIDTITDFTVGQDFFQLARAIFAAVGPDGTLAASAFHVGPAQTVDQHILYDNTTGNLYYDADGSGSGAPVEFAHVDAHLALTAASFHIYG